MTGYCDLQVNGFAGIDFNDEAITADGMDRALSAMAAGGVTLCLPTLITAPAEVLHARLRALDRAVAGSVHRAMVPGFHLEGPFLNPGAGFAGCHPVSAMGDPDPALLASWVAGLARPVLMLTLAPERPGGMDCIRWAVAHGIVASIGHADAGAAVVAEAVAAGATCSTHLGNGLPRLLPKFDNPLMAQLGHDGLAAGFIADGLHVPVPALHAMIRAKGPRAMLVTDAVAAAGCPPGQYRFAGMAVERLADGSVRAGGVLAGSSLTMADAVRNVVLWGIADAADARAMAVDAPRRVLAPALHAHEIFGW